MKSTGMQKMAGSGLNAIVSQNKDTPYVIAGIGDPGQREQTTGMTKSECLTASPR
jgi:hypothetical protein